MWFRLRLSPFAYPLAIVVVPAEDRPELYFRTVDIGKLLNIPHPYVYALLHRQRTSGRDIFHGSITKAMARMDLCTKDRAIQMVKEEDLELGHLLEETLAQGKGTIQLCGKRYSNNYQESPLLTVGGDSCLATWIQHFMEEVDWLTYPCQNVPVKRTYDDTIEPPQDGNSQMDSQMSPSLCDGERSTDSNPGDDSIARDEMVPPTPGCSRENKKRKVEKDAYDLPPDNPLVIDLSAEENVPLEPIHTLPAEEPQIEPTVQRTASEKVRIFTNFAHPGDLLLFQKQLGKTPLPRAIWLQQGPNNFVPYYGIIQK